MEQAQATHEQGIEEHEECKDGKHTKLLAEAVVTVLVLVQLHGFDALN